MVKSLIMLYQSENIKYNSNTDIPLVPEYNMNL